MLKKLIFSLRTLSHHPLVTRMIPRGPYLQLKRTFSGIFYALQTRSRVDNNTIMLADYPRCGIGWIRHIVATVLHYKRTGEFEKLTPAQMYRYTPTLAGSETYTPYYFNGTFSLLKTHHDHMPCFTRGIIIYRDPYKAIRSYYAHKLMEEGTIITPRRRGRTDEESFLMQEARAYRAFHDGWQRAARSHPERFFVIRYEDLMEGPEPFFRGILDFLGIPLADLPQDAIPRLARMYERTDVSIPRVGKQPPEEAFAVKKAIFARIDPIMTEEHLAAIDPRGADELRKTVQDMDRIRYRPVPEETKG